MTFHKKHPSRGAPPGTLLTDDRLPPPKIRATRYSPDQIEESDVTDVSAIRGILEQPGVVWVDVQGLGDTAVLQALADVFGLHALAIEDVTNCPQRPKAEPYDDHLFLVTRMVRMGNADVVKHEQISILLGAKYVLTFEERPGDIFDPVRERLRSSRIRIRSLGPDYLAYALLDAVIDGYYPVVEALGERLAELEEEALGRPTKETLRATNEIRKALLLLRRLLGPQREAISLLIRDETPLLTPAVLLFFRDVHDHCTQIAEVVDSYREVVSGVANTYLTVVSNRTNDVMKVLTIMASIFIPLTFMAGIYGMNFEHMPELSFRYSYPLLWAAMLAVAGGMIAFFYRRGWLSSDDD